MTTFGLVNGSFYLVEFVIVLLIEVKEAVHHLDIINLNEVVSYLQVIVIQKSGVKLFESVISRFSTVYRPI